MKQGFLGLMMAVAITFGLTGCGGSVRLGPEAVAGLTPDATISMRQVQVAFLASGGGGTGTIHYRGENHNFTIAGLGVGGIGASTLDAEGEVYRLPNLAAFPGAYAQGRFGFALGTASGGELWLQNQAGVILRLRAARTGLMLSLGGDAVVISMR